MTEIPKAGKYRDTKWSRIFRQCDSVGDNFFIPFTMYKQCGFASVIKRWNAVLAPWHFVSRTKTADGKNESANGKLGFRVWRDR